LVAAMTIPESMVEAAAAAALEAGAAAGGEGT
jgi:hypothetical protein